MLQNKVLALTAISVVLCVALSGCTSSPDQQKILGSWKRMNYDTDQIWTFKDDGSIDMSTNNLNISYGFEDGHLWIYYTDIGFLDNYNYSFEGNDVLMLHLNNNNDVIANETGPQNNVGIRDFIFNRV